MKTPPGARKPRMGRNTGVRRIPMRALLIMRECLDCYRDKGNKGQRDGLLQVADGEFFQPFIGFSRCLELENMRPRIAGFVRFCDGHLVEGGEECIDGGTVAVQDQRKKNSACGREKETLSAQREKYPFSCTACSMNDCYVRRNPLQTTSLYFSLS